MFKKRKYVKPAMRVIDDPELLYSGLDAYSNMGDDDGVWAVRSKITIEDDTDNDSWCEDPMIKTDFKWNIRGL